VARDAPPTLRGERLTLRPAVDEDVPALVAMLAEPEVASWWGRHDAARVRAELPGTFAIVVDGELRGWLHVSEETDPDYRHVGFDIALASAAQGRGLGPEALRIEVTGKQWWWEVRYFPPGRSEPVVSANELRLPVGEPVELRLSASDVIHSFWLPSIAGKRDMIPGRVNHLVLEVEQAGVYRGQCAEYCGGPHALMAFSVEVMEPAAFEQWLAQQAEGAELARERARAAPCRCGCSCGGAR